MLSSSAYVIAVPITWTLSGLLVAHLGVLIGVPLAGGPYGWQVLAMLLTTLVLPLYVAARVWKALQPTVSLGLCTRCGYDLRGSAGLACPECGAPVPAPPAEARPAE